MVSTAFELMVIITLFHSQITEMSINLIKINFHFIDIDFTWISFISTIFVCYKVKSGADEGFFQSYGARIPLQVYFNYNETKTKLYVLGRLKLTHNQMKWQLQIKKEMYMKKTKQINSNQ